MNSIGTPTNILSESGETPVHTEFKKCNSWYCGSI